MTLLTPLGLLGLLALIVLILIYIIKPNYQQKFISSTFVWKLSTKYVKRRLPTSKLKNLIIIICQVLILTLCAGILAQPVQIIIAKIAEPEVIAIIDSSASMRAESNGVSRFERAVEETMELAENTYAKNGIVSVIMAEGDARFLTARTAAVDREQTYSKLDQLLLGDTACSYGTADINSAISLSESIIEKNPSAKIYLYTDNRYAFVPSGITLVDVTTAGEWNAAILNAYSEIVENYYSVVVDVACYGRDMGLELSVQVNDANIYDNIEQGKQIKFSQLVVCSNDAVQRVIFRWGKPGNEPENTTFYSITDSDRFFSYRSINVTINTDDDCFSKDNSFDIYDGQKQVIKVQYSNPNPNTFFTSVLDVIKNSFINRWDVQIDETNGPPSLSGYDFYIFENTVPAVLPTDGVVFLVAPNNAPVGSGLTKIGVQDFDRQSNPLTEEMAHPILNNIIADNITISLNTLFSAHEDYEVLMSCRGYPALMVKNQGNSKVAVMTFSVHYSNLVISQEFPIMLYNMFEYFMPSTIIGNSFEVYQEISLNARSQELKISHAGIEQQVFTEFPASYVVSIPGTYILTQKTYFGKDIKESIYIRIPAGESNIWNDGVNLVNPPQPPDNSEFYQDLLLYIAASLVALLFIEWWLQSRQGM